jgi:hypothetical protein
MEHLHEIITALIDKLRNIEYEINDRIAELDNLQFRLNEVENYKLTDADILLLTDADENDVDW